MAVGSFGGGGGLGMGVSFTLKDRFSKTSSKIQRKMRGLSSSSSKNFGKINGVIKKHSKAIALYGGAALVGLGIAAAAVFNQFVKFDDHMADVRKTVGLTAKETKKFGNTILNMSKKTRTSIEDLVSIASIGGRMGIGKKDIEGFTKSVNILGVAIGDEFGSVDEMTNSVGKLRNVMSDFKTDDAGADVLHIGNALNSLSSSGQATAGAMSDMSKRILSQTAGLKISSGDVLGLSAVLEEAGQRSERAGSGTARLLSTMSNNYTKFAKVAGMGSKEFADILNNDANKALTSFMKGLKGSNLEGIEYNKLLKSLGINGTGVKGVLGALTKNIDKLAKKQKQATGELKGTNSVMDEYDIKNKNAAAQIAKFKSLVRAVVIQIGRRLKPVFGALVSVMTVVISAFVSLWKALGPFVQGVLGYIAAGVGIVATAFIAYAAAQAIATSAIWLNTIALLANPMTWIILGIIALIAVIIKLIQYFGSFTAVWEVIKTVFTKIWDFIKFVSMAIWSIIKKAVMLYYNIYKTIFMAIWTFLSYIFTTIYNAIKSSMLFIWDIIKTSLMFIWNIHKTIFMAIWNVISTVFTWISDKITWIMDIFVSFGTKLYNVGSNIVTSIWEGIKSGWNTLVSWMSSAVDYLMDIIMAPIEWIKDIGSYVGDLFGGDSEHDVNVNRPSSGGGSPSQGSGYGGGGGNHFVPSSSKNITSYQNETVNNSPNIVLKNEMDGDVISENMIERQRRNNARKE